MRSVDSSGKKKEREEEEEGEEIRRFGLVKETPIFFCVNVFFYIFFFLVLTWSCFYFSVFSSLINLTGGKYRRDLNERMSEKKHLPSADEEW